MRQFILACYLLLVCASVPASDAGPGEFENLSPAKLEVLSAVESRWQAWANDDFDGYLSAHHPSWRRWSSSHSSLEDIDDIPAFWQKAKEMEATLSFEIIPTSIEIFDDGRSAAIHYIAHEKIRLLKDRTIPGGRVNPAGKENVIRIRFSDFMVNSEGTWLLLGGYKDGNCALFRGFGRTCEE